MVSLFFWLHHYFTYSVMLAFILLMEKSLETVPRLDDLIRLYKFNIRNFTIKKELQCSMSNGTDWPRLRGMDTAGCIENFIDFLISKARWKMLTKDPGGDKPADRSLVFLGTLKTLKESMICLSFHMTPRAVTLGFPMRPIM